MKPEMRQKLAREPFGGKIRKVGQLIRLARSFPRHKGSQLLRATPTQGKLVKRKGHVVWTGKLPKGVNSANAVTG
jgi:hypothetical protein